MGPALRRLDEALPGLTRRFRVHRDRPSGHGHSRDIAVRGFDAAAALVASSVPDGAVVCGWSLGGLIAQRIAGDGPGKVRALALEAARLASSHATTGPTP
jgi:pimeloyl-ACP methyl ester carboxylesterase